MKNIIYRLKDYKYMTFMVIIFLFVQTGADLLLPTYLALIIDRGVVQGDFEYILKTGFLMLLIASLGGLGTVVSSYYSAKIGLGFSKSIREDIFQKVGSFSLKEVDDIGTASLITRTTNDVIQVQNFLISALRMFVRAPIMAVGGIILALSMDPSLSLILAVVVGVLIVLIIIITRKTSKLYKKLQDKLDNLNLLLRERLVGIRVLRAFNREEEQMKKYNDNNIELTETAIRINRIMAVMMPGMMLLMNFLPLLYCVLEPGV
jgi:ATP-binding cassette subfamily B protein